MVRRDTLAQIESDKPVRYRAIRNHRGVTVTTSVLSAVAPWNRF